MAAAESGDGVVEGEVGLGRLCGGMGEVGEESLVPDAISRGKWDRQYHKRAANGI